jgi:hypothetical protein
LNPKTAVDGSWLMVPTPCVATILALTHQVNITDVAKPWIDTMNPKIVVGG